MSTSQSQPRQRAASDDPAIQKGEEDWKRELRMSKSPLSSRQPDSSDGTAVQQGEEWKREQTVSAPSNEQRAALDDTAVQQREDWKRELMMSKLVMSASSLAQRVASASEGPGIPTHTQR